MVLITVLLTWGTIYDSTKLSTRTRKRQTIINVSPGGTNSKQQVFIIELEVSNTERCFMKISLRAVLLSFPKEISDCLLHHKQSLKLDTQHLPSDYIRCTP